MKRNERGIALVITLFLMATLSALAVSMMFLAQTETAASRNYRTMSQARYAAEAGVHEMANYLMNTGYLPAANFDATKSPVACTGGGCAHAAGGSGCTATSVATAVSTGCVVVGYSTATSNNPDATLHTPTASTLAVNSSGSTTNAAAGTVTYTAAAILLAQKAVTIYGGGTGTVQTWQIIADGTVPPSTAAIVEVSSTIEREVGFATSYAVFATNPLCGAIDIGGNASTNSYNSAALASPSAWSGGSVGTGTPKTVGTGGGIGTNGNLNVGGSVAIGGTLSTPRTGAGTCSNSNVDAITGSGHWSYGGTHQLSQSVSYPAPTIPTLSSTVAASTPTLQASAGSAICNAQLVGTGWLCSISGTKLTLTPGPTGPDTLILGNVTVNSNTDVVIQGRAASAGPPAITAITDTTIVVNSFKLGSNASLSLADGSVGTMPKANVVMEIAGQSLGSTLPLDMSGSGSVNTNSGLTGTSGYDSSRLQILYAGAAEIDMVGNNSIAATVYAPNAYVNTVGSGSLFGSILASKFKDQGGATINYDSSLATKFSLLGNYMLTSFSWKKY
jgi:Tfp pilus assembly protein PilX